MSLLHNAKKHFILAMVFVLAISNVGFIFTPMQKAAAEEEVESAPSRRSGLTKAMINSVGWCIANAGDVNDDTAASQYSKGALAGGDDIGGSHTDDVVHLFLYGDEDQYDCDDGNRIEATINKISGLYGRSDINLGTKLKDIKGLNLKYDLIGAMDDVSNNEEIPGKFGEWTLKEYLYAYTIYYDKKENYNALAVREHLNGGSIPGNMDIQYRGYQGAHRFAAILAKIYDPAILADGVNSSEKSFPAIKDYTNAEDYWLTQKYSELMHACNWKSNIEEANYYEMWIKFYDENYEQKYCAWNGTGIGYIYRIDNELDSAYIIPTITGAVGGVWKNDNPESMNVLFRDATTEIKNNKVLRVKNECLDDYKTAIQDYKTAYPEYTQEIDDWEREYLNGRQLYDVVSDGVKCTSDPITTYIGTMLSELRSKKAKEENENEFNKVCRAEYSSIRSKAIVYLVENGLLAGNVPYPSQEQKDFSDKFNKTLFPPYDGYVDITRTDTAQGTNGVMTKFVIKKENGDQKELSYYLQNPGIKKEYLIDASTGQEIKTQSCHWRELALYYLGLVEQAADRKIKESIDIGSSEVEIQDPEDTTIIHTEEDPGITFRPQDGGYDGATYEPDTCYEGSGTLGWILCPLIAGASNIGEGLWNQIETYHLKLPANALFGSIGSTNESGIHFAWRSIRDIANIVFVIVFLIIVISQVTGAGISNYGIKKMLPKLIVCIVVVNLSYILCQIAVDLSNTIGSSITDFLRGIAGKIPWEIANVSNTGDGGLFSNGFITGVLIAGAAGGLFALIASMRTGQNGAGAIIGGLGLFILGIVIVILVAIITLYITLMIREAAVVVCIAIAPLAIACNVLPNTQPLFKKWLSLMKALLVLYPVSAFMVGGGQLAGAILASTGLNTMRLAAGVVQVLPYFFVPTLLRKSLAGLGNIGAKIGSLGKGLGRKASHGATGLVKNSRRYQDMLAGSKAKAENRYNRGEEARLRRKQERRRRHGRELSDQDALRLEAATDKNFARDTKIEEARVSSEADRVAARRRAASSDIAVKDAQLMNGGFADAANADAFAAARLAQARTETVNSRDKLMETYGGAQRDIYTGDMITNPDGSYVIDANRANAYAEGVRLSNQVSTRKEAEEKVAQAAHRQSLYLASARKSDIDLENNIRTARAYAEDMDENGNFVPAGTGTYHASDYVSNQRRTQENKTNSALASGYVRPMETTFDGAHNQAQIRASEEIGKAAESEFREMDKTGPRGLATRMDTMARNIGARDANGNRTFASPGQLETLESSIKVASSRGLEKEAYAAYNAALNSFGQAFAEAQASGNTTEMQEIQSRMDSFKRSMQSSPIKAISIHAKQTENMQIDSDIAAADADSYYQGAAFAGYADNKGGNLTIDKDSSAIFQRIGANFSAVHAMEQLGKNDLTQTQITDFAAMAERDLASNNTDISRALSARTLVNLPASTITAIASGTSDVNRNALMAAMNNISAQAMEKLTQEQVSALQALNPNFGNNISGNAGSNTGGNAGGNAGGDAGGNAGNNAGGNAGFNWGDSSDDDSGPFAI